MSLHRRVGAQTDGCAQPSIITTRASRAPNDAFSSAARDARYYF